MEKELPNTELSPLEPSNPLLPEPLEPNDTPAAIITQESLPTDNHKKPKHSHLTLLIIIIVLVIIAIGGLLVYGINHKISSTPVNKNNNQQVTTGVSNQGDNFYQTPQKLRNLNFFSNLAELFGTSCSGTQTTNCPPSITADQISYYQIGITAAKLPIIVAADYGAGDGSFFYVALEKTSGNYEILGKLSGGLDPTLASDSTNISTLQTALNTNVTLNTTDTISGFNFPQSTTLNGLTIAMPNGQTGPAGYFIDGLSGIRGSFYGTSPPSTVIKKIGQEQGISFYEVIAEDKDVYQVKEIYGTVNGIYAASYVVVDPLVASSAPAITWSSDGTINSATYSYSAQGCGSANGYVVTKNLDPSQLTEVGQGPNQEVIYELPANSTLFNDYYTDYGGGSVLSDNSLKNLSPTQFQNVHAIVVAKNALGEYVVYQRTDMSTGGGCGKPVIYLYPQTPTKVDISVGANISVSNPTYTKFGWQNVLALPGGKLTYQGVNYNSLFWEGTGIGSYPVIDQGTIVPKSQVVSTIRLQLKQQGLTSNEISDFLTYWQPRLPSSPYTRLTWLNTSQMNELAPLQISPKPTTLIRVFLDFQGMERSYNIKSQTFSAPVRNGFTVVEWGGLLRN